MLSVMLIIVPAIDNPAAKIGFLLFGPLSTIN
jgi:hypothetical protein